MATLTDQTRMEKIKDNPGHVLRYKNPSTELISLALDLNFRLLGELDWYNGISDSVLIRAFNNLSQSRMHLEIKKPPTPKYAESASQDLMIALVSAMEYLPHQIKCDIKQITAERIEVDPSLFLNMSKTIPDCAAVFMGDYIDSAADPADALLTIAKEAPKVLARKGEASVISDTSGLTHDEIKSAYLEALDQIYIPVFSLPGSMRSDVEINEKLLQCYYEAFSTISESLKPYAVRLTQAALSQETKKDHVSELASQPKSRAASILIPDEKTALLFTSASGEYYSLLPDQFKNKSTFDAALKTSYKPLASDAALLSKSNLARPRDGLEIYTGSIPSCLWDDHLVNWLCDSGDPKNWQFSLQSISQKLNPSNVSSSTYEKLVTSQNWTDKVSGFEISAIPPSFLTESVLSKLMELNVSICNVSSRLITDKVKDKAIELRVSIPDDAQTPEWIEKMFSRLDPDLLNISTFPALNRDLVTPELLLKISEASQYKDNFFNNTFCRSHAINALSRHSSQPEQILAMVSRGVSNHSIPSSLLSFRLISLLAENGHRMKFKGVRATRQLTVWREEHPERFFDVFADDFRRKQSETCFASINKDVFDRLQTDYRLRTLGEKTSSIKPASEHSMPKPLSL